jgi:hypothetical protein
MRHFKTRYFVCLLLLGLLSACGGGGNDAGSSPAIVETYPLRTAWINYLSEARSYSFTSLRTDNPILVSGTLQQFAAQNDVFENAVVRSKVSVSSGTIQANNQTSSFQEKETIYIDANYSAVGLVDDGNGYAVVSSPSLIPQTAKIGDSGMIFVANLYASSDKSILLGTKSLSYVIEPETANMALLKLTETTQDPQGLVTDTIVSVFRITPSGNLTRISELESVEDIPLPVLVEYQPL